MFLGHVEAQFTVPTGETLSCTTNGGTTAVSVPDGTYFIDAFLTALQAALIAGRPVTAGTWVVTRNATTGQITIAVTNGTFSITFTSTDTRDLLGFTANIAAEVSKTGAAQACSIWFPDCVFRCDVDARRAPIATDHRNQMTPIGRVRGMKSTKMYRHANPRWMNVPSERTWEADAALANASYEQFLKDTQLQEGHAWFDLSSEIRIYDHTDTAAGVDAPVGSWQIPTLPGLDTLHMAEGIDNGMYYVITWPEIVGVV